MFNMISGGVLGVVTILILGVLVGIGVFTTIKWLIGLTRNKNER